jgi:hypothetical protein
MLACLLLGHMDSQRLDCIFWFLGGQLNSASSTEIGMQKIGNLLRLINEWAVQAGCLSKVGVRWSTYPSSANLASWFRDELPDMHTHMAHIMHKKVAHHQPSGTATFLCWELCCYMKQHCVDHRSLGHWCSTLFYADPNHHFCLVSACNMGCQKPQGDSTIYQQQLQYIQNNRIELSMLRLLIVDFVAQLQVWQWQGDQLLVLWI